MIIFFFWVQVMFSSHSMVQHTKTTVSWPWRTLVKMILPCSVWLTLLLVAEVKMGLSWVIGSSPMEVEFSTVIDWGILTEPEVRWWYVCIVEEVEWMGFTAVRYLFQQMLSRPYTLECTTQTVVRLSRVSSVSSKPRLELYLAHTVYLRCTVVHL